MLLNAYTQNREQLKKWLQRRESFTISYNKYSACSISEKTSFLSGFSAFNFTKHGMVKRRKKLGTTIHVTQNRYKNMPRFIHLPEGRSGSFFYKHVFWRYITLLGCLKVHSKSMCCCWYADDVDDCDHHEKKKSQKKMQELRALFYELKEKWRKCIIYASYWRI